MLDILHFHKPLKVKIKKCLLLIQMGPVVINKWKKNNETGIIRGELVSYIILLYTVKHTLGWLIHNFITL